jgi:hypothetical protein
MPTDPYIMSKMEATQNFPSDYFTIFYMSSTALYNPTVSMMSPHHHHHHTVLLLACCDNVIFCILIGNKKYVVVVFPTLPSSYPNFILLLFFTTLTHHYPHIYPCSFLNPKLFSYHLSHFHVNPNQLGTLFHGIDRGKW